MKQFKLVLLSTIFLLFLTVPYAQAHDIYVPNYVYFPTQGQYINFASQQTLDTWRWDTSSDYQYFNGYGFQVETGNLSITTFFVSDTFVFDVTAPSGNTSTTRIYTASRGVPSSVTVDTVEVPINYNSGTRILTVSVVHSSSATVEVYWEVSAWSTSVLAVWNIVPVIFLLGFALTLYVKNKREKLDLREIVIYFVGFFIFVLMFNIVMRFWVA